MVDDDDAKDTDDDDYDDDDCDLSCSFTTLPPYNKIMPVYVCFEFLGHQPRPIIDQGKPRNSIEK